MSNQKQKKKQLTRINPVQITMYADVSKSWRVSRMDINKINGSHANQIIYRFSFGGKKNQNMASIDFAFFLKLDFIEKRVCRLKRGILLRLFNNRAICITRTNTTNVFFVFGFDRAKHETDNLWTMTQLFR